MITYLLCNKIRILSLGFRDLSKEANKKLRPFCKGRSIIRDTTLIPGALLQPDSLQRTNIRVSGNGEMPSAPNEVQRRSSERSFISIIVLARTGRQLSEKQWYRLLSLVIRFTNISLPDLFLEA